MFSWLGRDFPPPPKSVLFATIPRTLLKYEYLHACISMHLRDASSTMPWGIPLRYFATQVEELKEVYETVYLIRNERKYHLYSFDDGKRFEPDYILILGNKSTVVEQQQIFIEPKGQHLIDNDIWKEHFLLQLENGSKCVTYPDYDNYSVKGLPFYTHNVKEQRFKEYFEKLYKHN